MESEASNLMAEKKSLTSSKKRSYSELSEKDNLINLNFRGTSVQVELKSLKQLPRSSEFFNRVKSRYHISLHNLATSGNGRDSPTSTPPIYLNRTAAIFDHVLDYTETGTLHFPHNLCSDTVRQELQFWGFAESDLASCCWERLATETSVTKKHEEVVRKWQWLRKPRKMVKQELPCGEVAYKTPLREKIRMFFDDCGSSIYARIWGIFLGLTIVMSLITLILITEHSLRLPPFDEFETNITLGHGVYKEYTANSYANPVVGIIEIGCLLILTFEYLVRFLVSSDKCRFLIHPLNITDLLGILPMWALLVVRVYREKGQLFSESFETTITVFTCLKLFRILRFVRLMTYSKEMRIIYIAFMISYKEIAILSSLIFLLSFLFGSAIYFAEMGVDSFKSIMIGQWWAIITMTTVGYGDYAPKTSIGYLIGVFCSLAGIVHIALATTVVVNNYMISKEGVEKYLREKQRILASEHDDLQIESDVIICPDSSSNGEESDANQNA